MDAFPAFVPLKGRRVIVVGEGEMADGKAALFQGSPADLIRRPADAVALEPATYAGAALVFVASADEDFAKAAARAAREGGALLVNVVDRPALCDFYTPAIVDRGAVAAAVGTTGSGPMLAGRLKAEIDRVIPAHAGALANMLKAIQGEVRARFPAFAARKAFLASVLDGPAGAAALAGDPAEGERLARAMLQAQPTAPSPIIVRSSQPDDNAALEAIFRDTFESTWRPNISEAAAQVWLNKDRPAAYVAERGAEFWVAERDGVVLGLVHWRDDFVHALHVHSSHAREGVGGRLMDHAETEIAKAGFPTARLETDTFNEAARTFYSARGYVEADRYPDEEWNSDLTTILLVKALRGS